VQRILLADFQVSMSHSARPDLSASLADRLTVERAVSDLRRSTPVILTEAGQTWLVISAEAATAGAMVELIPDGAPLTLVLTANRAEALGLAIVEEPGALVARRLRAPSEAGLADPTHPAGSGAPGSMPLTIDVPLPAVADAAIRLMKAGQLLPSALLVPLAGPIDGLISLPRALVLDATLQGQPRLRRLSDARVPLTGAEKTRVVSFRDQVTGIDHLALLIGDPLSQDAPLVRLHSSCITGDLLGSLRCDCGEQLRGAIVTMNDAGGGILLYLQQEGRGIGIVNKLRAYALQDGGMDTVDANTTLGFENDERDFSLAAEMLRQLDVPAIRLLTNNPRKVGHLAGFGIEVRERVQHAFPGNPHNRRYLAAKASKAGHLLPAEDESAR
jgi:GTP cyclohydrolase II